MAEERRPCLVFVDTAGKYYLMPFALLESAQVSEEQQRAVERQLGEEVSGYITPIPIPGGSWSLLGQFNLAGLVFPQQVIRFDPGGGLGHQTPGT